MVDIVILFHHILKRGLQKMGKIMKSWFYYLFFFIHSQEQVCELYQQLHHSGGAEQLELFESVILGVLKDLRQHQVENERLEKSYKR